ncbi:hypothetical protein AHAS_Ahas19G0239100 [Arachis hypogaea]
MHHRLTNRANRTLARSLKYTSGLATFTKTKARMSKSLDRDATMAETFKYTHIETTSEPYKNCFYRLGSFFVNDLRTSTLRTSSASVTSWPIDPKDGVDLREQVLKPTQNLR